MKTVIRLIKKPEVTELGGEKVMIDFELGKYFMLKGVANDIWDLLEDGVDISDITDELLKRYNVEREVCNKSVIEFCESLQDKGFIELVYS